MAPALLRRILELRAPPAVEKRVQYLAEKSNEGLLSADERTEYELIVQVTKSVSVLQSKARKLLEDLGSA